MGSQPALVANANGASTEEPTATRTTKQNDVKHQTRDSSSIERLMLFLEGQEGASFWSFRLV